MNRKNWIGVFAILVCFCFLGFLSAQKPKPAAAGVVANSGHNVNVWPMINTVTTPNTLYASRGKIVNVPSNYESVTIKTLQYPFWVYTNNGVRDIRFIGDDYPQGTDVPSYPVGGAPHRPVLLYKGVINVHGKPYDVEIASVGYEGEPGTKTVAHGFYSTKNLGFGFGGAGYWFTPGDYGPDSLGWHEHRYRIRIYENQTDTLAKIPNLYFLADDMDTHEGLQVEDALPTQIHPLSTSSTLRLRDNKLVGAQNVEGELNPTGAALIQSQGISNGEFYINYYRTSDRGVYLYFAIVDYNVTYNTEHGVMSTNNRKQQKYEKVFDITTEPSIRLIPESKEFLGWRPDQTITTKENKVYTTKDIIPPTETVGMFLNNDVVFTAVFKDKTVKVTTEVKNNIGGTISPGQTLPYGGSYTIVTKPSEGYRIKSLTANGLTITGTLLSNLKKDTHVVVEYEKLLKVTYKSDPHGTITGKTSEWVPAGGSPTGTTEQPKAGWKISGWKADKPVTLDGKTCDPGFLLADSQLTKCTITEDTNFTVYHEPDFDAYNNAYLGKALKKQGQDIDWEQTFVKRSTLYKNERYPFFIKTRLPETLQLPLRYRTMNNDGTFGDWQTVTAKDGQPGWIIVLKPAENVELQIPPQGNEPVTYIEMVDEDEASEYTANNRFLVSDTEIYAPTGDDFQMQKVKDGTGIERALPHLPLVFVNEVLERTNPNLRELRVEKEYAPNPDQKFNFQIQIRNLEVGITYKYTVGTETHTFEADATTKMLEVSLSQNERFVGNFPKNSAFIVIEQGTPQRKATMRLYRNENKIDEIEEDYGQLAMMMGGLPDDVRIITTVKVLNEDETFNLPDTGKTGSKTIFLLGAIALVGATLLGIKTVKRKTIERKGGQKNE